MIPLFYLKQFGGRKEGRKEGDMEVVALLPSPTSMKNSTSSFVCSVVRLHLTCRHAPIMPELQGDYEMLDNGHFAGSKPSYPIIYMVIYTSNKGPGSALRHPP